MRPVILVSSLLAALALVFPVAADVGPPIDCTVAERSNNTQECVECMEADCATSLGAGYSLECTQPGGTEIWCRAIPDDEKSGCASITGGDAGLGGQLIFAALLFALGLALHRRSRARAPR